VIISVSRRTDIPAFYAEWFMNRIRAGYCTVPNPFNPSQISRVSLKQEEVDVIVFWTRNPRPLLPHLSELDRRGYKYYFLYTIMANPREIDPGSPRAGVAIGTFRDLSNRIGPEKVIWRYDPIFLSSITDFDFHQRTYRHVAGALKGYTLRSMFSVAHLYRKIQRRIGELEKRGITLLPLNEKDLAILMCSLAETASQNGIQIRSCADELNLQHYGILPGKCVDDELISQVFGLNLEVKKDSCQRKQCGCIQSKDIGMYESCPLGCIYCYATTSFERAIANYRIHDPHSHSLIIRPERSMTDRAC
jgi:hypothetical protein